MLWSGAIDGVNSSLNKHQFNIPKQLNLVTSCLFFFSTNKQNKYSNRSVLFLFMIELVENSDWRSVRIGISAFLKSLSGKWKIHPKNKYTLKFKVWIERTQDTPLSYLYRLPYPFWHVTHECAFNLVALTKLRSQNVHNFGRSSVISVRCAHVDVWPNVNAFSQTTHWYGLELSCHFTSNRWTRW